MSGLCVLADRLEAGSGSSMALAREIQCALGWHRLTPSLCGRKHGGYIAPGDWVGGPNNSPILDGLHGTTIYRDVPDVTSSIDATEDLRKRLLISSHLECWAFHDFTACTVYMDGQPPAKAKAKSEPRARLAALLRAIAGGVDG